MTSDVPRQKLCEMVRRFGTSVSEDSRRCEGLLRDLCGGHQREINALVAALKERIAEELLSASEDMPREVLAARLAKRLEDRQGIDKDLARWVALSWGVALGRFSPDSAAGEELHGSRPEDFRLQQREERARIDEDRNRIADEWKRLEQDSSRLEKERRNLDEEKRRLHSEQSKAGDKNGVEKERRRKQLLVGSLAVGLVVAVGSFATLWNKRKATEEALRQTTVQLASTKLQIEADRKQIEDLRRRLTVVEVPRPRAPIATRFSLRLSNGRTLWLADGVRLGAADIPGLQPSNAYGVVAEVKRNPRDSNVLGLQNLSRSSWLATQANGSRTQVQTGWSVAIGSGRRISFGLVDGEIQ